MFRIVFAADNTSQHDGLVADDARAALDRSRVDAAKFVGKALSELQLRPVERSEEGRYQERPVPIPLAAAHQGGAVLLLTAALLVNHALRSPPMPAHAGTNLKA